MSRSVANKKSVHAMLPSLQPVESREVLIPAGDVTLEGTIALPRARRAVVVFAHGSGSSRHSPRNLEVARVLHRQGFGTLLFDLLTPAEDRDYAKRFDIGLLAERLRAGTEFLAADRDFRLLPFGYFGASTGAAAALTAAVGTSRVKAIVSRGGRPDLAGAEVLGETTAPTLLIVGDHDPEVLALNRRAHALMHCERSLAIVAGATHLFEEPGALEEVAGLAANWFATWLAGTGASEEA